MNFNHFFTDFPDSSRVWVYTPSRVLNDEEKLEALKVLKEFVNSWKAHGSELRADVGVFGPGVVVIILDETSAGATGCSIDSLTHVVKAFGQQWSVDFFDRLGIWVEGNGGKWERRQFMSDKFGSDEMIFDATVQNWGDLKHN